MSVLPIQGIERVRLTRNVLVGSVHTGKPRERLDLSWRDLHEEREGIGAAFYAFLGIAVVLAVFVFVPIVRFVMEW